jgi:hypothetical protein
MSLPLILALLLLLGLVVIALRWSSGAGAGVDRQLLRAVGGNHALAKRLLEQVRWKYPGKSERWYVEKVIFDLERDRGRY